VSQEEPMALEFSICEIQWRRYRRVSENQHSRDWLKFQSLRGLAANTLDAYGRDLDAYLGFLESAGVALQSVVRSTVGAYIEKIAQCPAKWGSKVKREREPHCRMRLCSSISQSFDFSTIIWLKKCEGPYDSFRAAGVAWARDPNGDATLCENHTD
jgi:hypothetical protein